MKKISFIAFLVFSAAALNAACGAQVEPDGFRGIKWGAKISEVADMILLPGPRGNEGFYVRKADALQMGKAELEIIKYGFYKNRFYIGIIQFKSASNFDKLKEALKEEFGDEKQPYTLNGQYFWDWPNVNVSIDYRTKKDEGTVIYYYKPIRKQKLDDIKAEKKLKRMKQHMD